MAQQCEICGKKPQAGNRISHAHNVTKRRWNINLRPVHATWAQHQAHARLHILPAQRQSRQSVSPSQLNPQRQTQALHSADHQAAYFLMASS